MLMSTDDKPCQATPRTDAQEWTTETRTRVVWASFARTLETELAAAKAECNRLYESSPTALDALTAELARLRAELKELSQAYELNRVSIDELDADRARAERAETELAAAKKRIDDCEFLLAHRYKIIERQEPRIKEANARAERAEAELANEKARLDWLEKRGPWDSWNGFGEQGVTLTTSNVRAAIDACVTAELLQIPARSE